MSRPILELDKVTVFYGGFKAVEMIHLSLDKGEVWGLVGPKGAGKSTVMRVVGTLLPPTYGLVWLKDINVYARLKEMRKIIGFMSNDFGLYDNLKAREYLAYFLSTYSREYETHNGRIGKALETVGFSADGDLYIKELDKPSRNKLLLARAIIHDPELLVLDEPLAGLDHQARVEMQKLFASLADQGKTILISSDILKELDQICTNVAFIEAGILKTSGQINIFDESRDEVQSVLLIKVLHPHKVKEALSKEIEYHQVNGSEDLFQFIVNGDEDKVAELVEMLVAGDARPVTVQLVEESLVERFIRISNSEKL